MKNTRILIVDDSFISRQIIKEILGEEPAIEVVGEAENGLDAVSKANELKPDIITMDLNMPVLDGLSATERIMAENPTPILIISGIDDAETAIAAVSRGALELYSKDRVNPEQGKELIDKILLLAGVRVIRHIRSSQSMRFREKERNGLAPADPGGQDRIIAVASSTGGPEAIVKIFNGLDPDFSFPIVLAQHISADFSAEMVKWLSQVVKHPVVMGEAGMQLEKGRIHVSPSDKNMGVDSRGVIYLREREPGGIYFPSCDFLLSSVAFSHNTKCVGVILTGMGKDGAEGISAIKKAGGYTIAQNEETCVIFGMPKVAIETGHVDSILSLEDIIKDLNKLAAS